MQCSSAGLRSTRGLVTSTSNIFDTLIRRYLIEQIYPESQVYRDKVKNLLSSPVSVYAGFDATSDSLHVGNLVSLMNLLHFHRNGHRAICVIGDATAKIGDPSGHTKDRKRIDDGTIERNANLMQSTIETIFRNHDKYFSTNIERKLSSPIIIRNSSWYHDVNVINFVCDIFREVRVGSLLHKKSISERLDSSEGMNMSEFSYQIFQAYDWLKLKHLYDCDLQVGGSDQAGNIYTGHEVLKKVTKSDAIGLLTPLIPGESGKKLGKTSGTQNNIWLNPEKSAPSKLYQFFRRTPDRYSEKLLKIFTFCDDEVIDNLIKKRRQPDDSWPSQTKLAEQVCLLIHGEDGLKSVEGITRSVYANSAKADV